MVLYRCKIDSQKERNAKNEKYEVKKYDINCF